MGAGAGQYSDKRTGIFGEAGGGDTDPHSFATTQTHSYGVESRLSFRAIVVEGTNGERVALIKSDNYLAQDYLSRRAAQILAAQGSQIAYDDIFHMASHNHSSPYYFSPSGGVWLFQDAFDMRAFEYEARQMALAIKRAEDSLVPARMGGTTVTHEAFKGMIQRATIADDGTPGGYPADFGDYGLSVLRFDDISGPEPKPLATLMNWGQHPESLDSYDLITADFLAPLQRYVERETGSTLVFGQGDVGSAEAGPGRPDKVPDGIHKAWSHQGHAQKERGARLLADSVIEAWNAIGSGDAAVPFSSDFPVMAGNAFVPGPVSHPYPSVSNCRSENTVEGNPGAPVLGLPDCARAGGNDPTNQTFENMRAEGIPVPDHYDAPSFGAVEENARIHLQAFRLGEVLLASCACEAQVDLILNLESRTDKTQDNLWDGYDWTERLGCTQASAGGDWTCKNPKNESQTITFSDARYQRMQAQIHNDAKGWDLPENSVAANSEPSDPDEIWGNFTKEELPENLGYGLPIGFGHTGDYVGYTVSYREYMAYDSYRKALTAYGPHTADYMVTRLVRLAGELKGGPALEPEPLDAFAQIDEARMIAESTALGVFSAQVYDAWRAAIPNDVVPVEALTQPKDITRFDAATFSWRGGSNAVDNPVVHVEFMTDDGWTTYADQSGEIQTMVDFPDGIGGIANTYAGNQEWKWTANFEAFDAFPRDTHAGGQVPNGSLSLRGGRGRPPGRSRSELSPRQRRVQGVGVDRHRGRRSRGWPGRLGDLHRCAGRLPAVIRLGLPLHPHVRGILQGMLVPPMGVHWEGRDSHRHGDPLRLLDREDRGDARRRNVDRRCGTGPRRHGIHRRRRRKGHLRRDERSGHGPRLWLSG